MGMYGSRAVTLLVLISDNVINRILKPDIQTNILVYVTRCCTDLTSKVLKERTFGQSSAVLYLTLSWSHESWAVIQEMNDSLNFATYAVGTGNKIIVENMFIK